MMTGTVTARCEAVLPLTLRDAQGQDQAHNVLVDTGYNGWLTLPPAVISALGLRWQRYGRAILADGSEAVFNIYEGIILWDGQPLMIDIDEIDADALMGMSLMRGYELVLPVAVGATFTLRPIARPQP